MGCGRESENVGGKRDGKRRAFRQEMTKKTALRHNSLQLVRIDVFKAFDRRCCEKTTTPKSRPSHSFGYR
jgi:hypothetical protein